MVLILFHAITTFMLTGLIWTIQYVHYPLFDYLDKTTFAKANQFHQHQISKFVVPLMLGELLSGIYLTLSNSEQFILKLNLILIALIWLHTFGIMVPIHRQLIQGFSKELISKLSYANWPRTALWSIKSTLMTGLLFFS